MVNIKLFTVSRASRTLNWFPHIGYRTVVIHKQSQAINYTDMKAKKATKNNLEELIAVSNGKL